MESLQSNTDDSRVALTKAYNAVRERYNKLRLCHRQLLKDRTCSQCRQKRNATVDSQTTSALSQKSSSNADELHEICDQLKQLLQAEQVIDGSCAIQSIIPRLENVASQITVTGATFDEQQESVLDVSTSEMSSSFAVSSTCVHQDSTAGQQDLVRISEDMAASKMSEMSGDIDHQDKNFIADTAPWLSDLQRVAEIATSQYAELKGVCKHLQQQNESLKRLVKQLVYERENHAMSDADNMTDGEWSLLDKC